MSKSFEFLPDSLSLHQPLGSGTLGIVHHGEIRHNKVAIKVISPQLSVDDSTFDKVLKLEIQSLIAIRHPNLCLFMGYSLQKPSMIISELLDYNLNQALKMPEVINSLPLRMRIARDICLSLNWLHAKNTYHGNLRPTNVLFYGNHNVKISDYGLNRTRKLISQIQNDGRNNPMISNEMDPSHPSNHHCNLPFWTAPELLEKTIHEEKQVDKISDDDLSFLFIEHNEPELSPDWLPPYLLHDNLQTKQDIYSFAIILWQLCTTLEPCYAMDLNHYSSSSPSSPYCSSDSNSGLDSFIEAVCLHDCRPIIPSHTLDSLKSLIIQCWQANPSYRPSFDTILRHMNHILIDCTITYPMANIFWKNAFLHSSDFGHVPWREFSNQFGQFIGLTSPASSGIIDLINNRDPKVCNTAIPFYFKCLYAVLIEDPANEVVKLETFGMVMDWVMPNLQSAASILNSLMILISKPWFHGNISGAEAEKRLFSKEVGTFLVRTSNCPSSIFALSAVSDNAKIEHYRIVQTSSSDGRIMLTMRNDKYYQTLEELIKYECHAKSFHLPCSGSMFYPLFHQVQKMQSGYIDE